MTPGSRTAGALDRLVLPLKRLHRIGGALAVLVVVIGLFALGAWLIRMGLGSRGFAVILVWTVVVLSVLAVTVLWVRLGRGYGRQALAGRLEAMGVVRRGSLLALLETQATGTSTELGGAADVARAEELVVVGGETVYTMAVRLRRRVLVLLGGLIVGLTALVAARPTGGSAALLWRPLAAIEMLLTPITLVARPTVVDRGGTVDVSLQAIGQRSATLWRRAPGEPWSTTTVRLDTAGRARISLGPVESDLYLRLSSGSRSTDTTRIQVRLPAFLGDLRLSADYPDYLGFEDEPLPVGSESVLLPAGTVVRTRGLSSVPLAHVEWQGPRDTGRVPLGVKGADFEGSFRPTESGEYVLRITTADGRRLAGDEVRLEVILVTDSIPVVDVLVPGADTLASAGLVLPLVVDIRDDHGVVEAGLVVRHSGRDSGITWREVLPLSESTAPRVLVAHVLDLSERGLVAGDTVRYRIQAFDNSPSRQMGTSREFLLIVPTQADERSEQLAATAEAQERLDSLVADGTRLRRETEALASQRKRTSDTEGDRPPTSLAFEDAQQAEEIAERQDEILKQAEELEATLDALREAVESGGLRDSTLARRLEEIREQLRDALSPELRARLDALQQALRDLDPEAMREALARLAEAQGKMQEALERNRELLERAALEGELSGLQQESEELSQAQREWNRATPSADSSAAAAMEVALAERADSVASGLERVAAHMDLAEATQALEAAAKTAKKAATQMRAAEAALKSGDRQQARAIGESAEASMNEVSRETQAQRQRQQEAWQQEVMAALDRALGETARLVRQQLGVMEDFRRAASLGRTRQDQAAVEESAQKLSDQIRAVSGQNAMVPPQIAVALAVARRHMSQAREAVSSASANPREAADQAAAAVDALNVAAFAMVRAKSDMGEGGSGSGQSEAAGQMQDAAQQQSQIAEDAASMLPTAGTPTAQTQLQELAARQQALAEAMDRLRAAGQVDGAEQFAEEAADLAQRLDAGQLDRETVDRQERLFRRMLDAGRTLQGEEEDEQKDRESTTASEGNIRLPPTFRRSAGPDPLRLPSWEELRLLTPEERRLVTDYFRRLTSGDRP